MDFEPNEPRDPSRGGHQQTDQGGREAKERERGRQNQAEKRLPNQGEERGAKHGKPAPDANRGEEDAPGVDDTSV
jgi:hypothetical protein